MRLWPQQEGQTLTGHRQRNVLLEGVASLGQPGKNEETRVEAKWAVSGSVGPRAFAWEDSVDGLQRMEAVLKAVQKKLKKEWLSGHEILSNGVRWLRVRLGLESRFCWLERPDISACNHRVSQAVVACPGVPCPFI